MGALTSTSGKLVILALLVGWGVAHAAAPVDPFSEPDEVDLFRTEQRLVTVASRYLQTVKQAPSIVTVFTDRELRERGFRTLSDALATVPGVFVTVSPESRDLAWFRGVISSDNNKFLLLVDGVPWYDGVYTHAWIDEYLPLEMVRQVEIIKGPGSAVYGSNAFAGVVNVVTYRARDLQGGFTRAVAGSDGRMGVAVVDAERLPGSSGAEVRAWARALSLQGDGVSVTPRGRANIPGLDPKRGVHGGIGLTVGGLDVKLDLIEYRHTYFTNEQDDALDVLLMDDDRFAFQYSNRFLSARYDVKLGSSASITPHLFVQQHNNPGSYAFFGDPESTVLADGSVSTRWDTTMVQAIKETVRGGGGVEARLSPMPGHTTALGAGADLTYVVALEDRRYEDLAHTPTLPSTFVVDPRRRLISDVYAHATHTWTAATFLELTGGARVDVHNFFGPFVSPRAGVLVVPRGDTTLKLLYGRAFRAPNARELSIRVAQEDGSNLFTASNPGLEPETIDTVELEVGARPSKAVELRGAGFASAVGNEITETTGDDPRLGDDFYVNRGTARVLGAEAEVRLAQGPLGLDLSAAYTSATDPDTGRQQYGFPPLMGHARLGWEAVPGLRLNLLCDAFGTRPRRAWTPDTRLPDGPAYALVHAGLATDALASGRVRFDLSIRNLLGTSYGQFLFVDDANAVDGTDAAGRALPRYPNDIEGEGRSAVVGIEVRL